MTRKTACIITILFTTILSGWAQRENFSYKFYGFVRGDLYYNSRQNTEAINGIFYLYPKDKAPDADGKDLNAVANSSFYTLTTRLGLDMTGPMMGTAKSSAKIEIDFGGFSDAFYMLRLRQAYLKLDWEEGSSVLLGQTWHPLWGDVFPNTVNLSTGSPFQPFNRSPQLRYQYITPRFTWTASAIYQLMSLSTGPVNKSDDYLKNGVMPEFFAGVNYHHNGFLGGIGVEMLSLKPRTQSTVGENTYKVDERLTTVSYMAQLAYETGEFTVSAKTVLASNLGHTSMLGGYWVKERDERTGKQDYISNRYTTSWLNMTYGKKWQGGIFAGYSKNLGTKEELFSNDLKNCYFGSGGDMDQLANGMLQFSYNIPHWRAGVEYSATTAWYGHPDKKDGKVIDTHSVTNHRVLFMFTYYF